MGELFATFGIEWDLLLIQAVNFAIVLAVLWWFLWKPLMKMLDARKATIAQGVADAAHAAKAKTESEAEAAGRIAAANTEANAVVSRAAEEGKKERAAILKEAQMRAEQVAKDAEAQAVEARRRALQESEKEIARAAVLAAEKILAK